MPSTATRVIDGLSTSVAIKPPCRVVAITNITLSGNQTIGGVSVGADETARVLCVGQTDQTENGIYNPSSGAWRRALDADGNRDLVKGSRVLVSPGGVDGIEYVLTTDNPVVIGTSHLTFGNSRCCSRLLHPGRYTITVLAPGELS